MNRTLKNLTIAGLVALSAFGLAACGVKGPLEPPQSSASAEARPAAAEAPVAAGEARTVAVPGAGVVGYTASSETVRGTSSSTTGTPAATQRSVLDWLID